MHAHAYSFLRAVLNDYTYELLMQKSHNSMVDNNHLKSIFHDYSVQRHLRLNKLSLNFTYSLVEIVDIFFKRNIGLHITFFIANFATGSTISRIEGSISAKNSTSVVTVVVESTKNSFQDFSTLLFERNFKKSYIITKTQFQNIRYYYLAYAFELARFGLKQ